MVSVGWGNGLFPSDRGGSGERCKDKITAAQIDEIVAAHHESRRLRIDDDDNRGMRYYREHEDGELEEILEAQYTAKMQQKAQGVPSEDKVFNKIQHDDSMRRVGIRSALDDADNTSEASKDKPAC